MQLPRTLARLLLLWLLLWLWSSDIALPDLL
jgi:hypothetical protein